MGKVRGRRGEQKSKKEQESLNENNDFVPLEDSNNQGDKGESSSSHNGDPKNTILTTFFGLVDSTELEYFKQAESNLNINAFETPEEKKNFIGSIFEEARGKELKLATNQLCSKLIERIILESNKKQMIQLFNAFNGHFVALSNQKYSSHCLETFFIRAASNVEKELLRESGEGEVEEEEEEEEEDTEGSTDAYISFENMFLFILAELKPNMKQMIPNQYASHVLRVLLLILAGKELPSSIESNSILRSKKSKIARKMIEIKDSTDYQRSFQTPSSFQDELTDTLKIIYKDQTSKSLREMAIEKVASPVIQLLVQLEGLVDKKRSFWCLIFNDYEVESDKKEEAFVEYLLSDPVGSHFLEVAIDSQRHKNVERLYNYYMKDRVLKLAKRETTGAFVIMTLLKKMKPNHQIELLDQLVPHLNELIVNNLEIGKSVVDCSIARNNYKKDEIISKFIQFFNKDLSSSSNTEEEGNEGKDSGNDKVQSQLLENVLRLSTSTLGNTRDDWPTAEERRRALFLEKLISYDDKILMAVIEGLLDLPVERLIQMCCHGVFSHVVENVLIPERVDFITRKKILNRLMNHIIELTCNAQGSHIVDKLWPFTTKLNVYKDRIAEELINNKEMVKKSVYGKLVWKNWSLDMYIRRRGDWKRLIKEQELEKFPPKENDSESPNTGDKRPQYKNNTNGKRPFRNDRYNGGDRGNRGDFKRSRY